MTFLSWPRRGEAREHDYRFGYRDENPHDRPFRWRWLPLILAVLFLVICWLFLVQKILFGSSWLSATYDNVDWRTNEGNLQTYGAWDLEAHIWKSEFIMSYWPHVLWNPYWYLGMPVFKYYQQGFYAMHIGVIKVFHLDPARAANMLVIFGHLAAVLLTFLLCLRISRRYVASALVAFFVLANTFLSLRSYGWEPITVVFLALYPLGLLVFLHEPLRPFRFWMVIALTMAYLTHPLIWFSLCMTLGLYLFSLSFAANRGSEGIVQHKIFTQYVFLILCSLLLGGFQSVNQFSYHQVTSGAHMGVTYLPFYHVAYNIITVRDFIFDYNNLKGPGPIIMLALLFLVVFIVMRALVYRRKRSPLPARGSRHTVDVLHNPLVRGFAFALLVMVLFYYLEYFNFFPMNLLRSTQYHRIIPEFIIAAACLLAAIAAQLRSRSIKLFYYLSLISFVIGGLFIIYTVQAHWQTVPSITGTPEFITSDVPGRISMPYTEQSLSVRNSFTMRPQVYGYYEQGITNSYTDEVFSVSSGFHNASLTILYLQAADVSRLYVNREAGERNVMLQKRLNNTLPFTEENDRYGYYTIPLANPSFAQAISGLEADTVQRLKPGCRILYQQQYCGSEREEFVGKDSGETRYLQAYVNMLERPYASTANYTMVDPDHHRIAVQNASADTAVVIKMTKDRSWDARIDGKTLPLEDIGPDFMIVRPHREGDYTILLTYRIPVEYLIGMTLSVLTFIGLCLYFVFRPAFHFSFPKGDMERSSSTSSRNTPPAKGKAR